MKNSVLILFVSLLFWSCQDKILPADVTKINGYWEIEKVVFPDGTVKNFSMNDSFDFFEIRNNNGFRQKVMPQLDGTFETNGLPEKVAIVFKDDKTYLKYETAYAKWQEELKAVSETAMVLLNAEQKTYYYKKTEPINLLGDGKKTQ